MVTGGSVGDPSQDLKELPLAEVEERLESSPDGLTADRGEAALGAVWAE